LADIQPDRHADQQTGRQKYRHPDRYEDRHPGDRQTKMQADKTDSEADRNNSFSTVTPLIFNSLLGQTNRQTDKQTDRLGLGQKD
jgi:hypothetical protein